MFRHFARTLTLALIASSIATSSALAASSALYRIEGRGWGHGIGMSQYGADGYAAKGLTGEQIITHYYTGTVVAPQPATAPTSVRVLLRSGLNPARVTVTSPGVLRQGTAQLALATGDAVEFQAVGASLVATRIHLGVRTAVAAGSNADAVVVPDVDGGAKINFSPDYGSSGNAYRGTITGHLAGGKVSVVNTLPLEQYLRGVVPGEMPSSWRPEALKAQAIAARSYALTGITGTGGYFDVYCTTQSQVYGGKNSERPTTDAAIAATAGKVARVGDANGQMARTYFFSTSASRTAASEDVWITPFPYLKSVVSPYETASPYFTWKGTDVQTYRPAVLAGRLGSYYGGAFKGITQTQRASGYVDRVNVLGSTRSGSLRGTDLQAKLGLRSSFFRIYLLSIAAPTTAKLGTYVKFGGQAPKLGITNVTFSTNGVAGKPVRLKVDASGRWKVTFKVRGKVIARMSRAGSIGPAIAVTPGAATSTPGTTISALD